MVLTPTYHVFDMYKGFQEAIYLPMNISCDSITVRGDKHAKDGRKIPVLNTSAAKQTDGSLIISLANISLDKSQTITIDLKGLTVKTVTGRILTSKNVTDYNDFEHPDIVKPAEFKKAKLKKNVITAEIPAKSIVVLNVK